MKKFWLTGTALLSFASVATFAADVTANIGWNSEYIFRGVPQDDSSAFAGLDLTEGGFYAGTWAADVGDGLEIDYYGGYSGAVGDFSYGIGATWYTYTDKFDDEYLELNLSGGWKFLTLDIAIGEYDNFDGPTLDYRFYSLTAEYNNFYGIVGIFDDDFDGEYYEAGYGNTLSVKEIDLVDYTFSAIYSSDDLLGGDDDISLVLSISKNFDLFSN